MQHVQTTNFSHCSLQSSSPIQMLSLLPSPSPFSLLAPVLESNPNAVVITITMNTYKIDEKVLHATAHIHAALELTPDIIGLKEAWWPWMQDNLVTEVICIPTLSFRKRGMFIPFFPNGLPKPSLTSPQPRLVGSLRVVLRHHVKCYNCSFFRLLGCSSPDSPLLINFLTESKKRAGDAQSYSTLARSKN